MQDAHYLRGYARALAICAAKAPDERDVVMFAEHAAQAIAAERDMHAALMAELGSSPQEAALEPVAPTTQAYVSYLLATAYGGSFAEAIGAVLPCYWIYARVGDELLARSSPDPLYARWIAMYGSEEFQAVVDSVLELTDRVGETVSDAERALMRQHFRTDVDLRVDVLGRRIPPRDLAGLTLVEASPGSGCAGRTRRRSPRWRRGTPRRTRRR